MEFLPELGRDGMMIHVSGITAITAETGKNKCSRDWGRFTKSADTNLSVLFAFFGMAGKVKSALLL